MDQSCETDQSVVRLSDWVSSYLIWLERGIAPLSHVMTVMVCDKLKAACLAGLFTSFFHF